MGDSRVASQSMKVIKDHSDFGQNKIECRGEINQDFEVQKLQKGIAGVLRIESSDFWLS
jgi:hypothetical protein